MRERATLYTIGDCALCAAARADLERRSVAYAEIDIGAHPERIPELLKLTRGRRIVPVIVTGTRIEIAPAGGREF
jgi:glutaredoxin 3